MSAKRYPVDKHLYERARRAAMRKFKVWPSPPASMWMMREYRRLGGRFGLKPILRRRRRPGRHTRHVRFSRRITVFNDP